MITIQDVFLAIRNDWELNALFPHTAEYSEEEEKEEEEEEEEAEEEEEKEKKEEEEEEEDATSRRAGSQLRLCEALHAAAQATAPDFRAGLELSPGDRLDTRRPMTVDSWQDLSRVY